VKFIEFRNVNKLYKTGEIKTLVLKDISFTVDEGEVVVILGKSGSGKSTLLNILGGMDRATGGKVFVGGKDITAYSGKAAGLYRRDKVGFVFQAYNLISGLTALENVELGAEVCKNHLDAAKMLARVGLKEKRDSFPSQLSGGEQQRVAIARALAKNPLMLLCDEPTGALDDANGKLVLTLLERINHTYSKTIILITHNNLIAPMADKVIFLNNGKIENIYVNTNKLRVEELVW
jgi:putative ABC transport system ATP-binding protein